MNKIEITKEMLERFISDKSMTFTLEEIEALMDSEVEKPEEEMDTELVAMCAEILAKEYCPEILEEKEMPMYRPWEHEGEAETKAPAQPKKKRVIRFKHVLLIAAALVVLVFVVALPAGAKLFESDTSDRIIEFYSDCFKINLNKNEATTAANEDDLVNEMILNSLDTFMLPEALLCDEYEKSAHLTQGDYMTTFYINVVNIKEKINGTIVITQYKDSNVETVNGTVNVSDTYDYFKQLSVNEKEVIVFGNDKQIYVNYVDGSTGYEIELDCAFETAISIAETIKEKG